MLFRLLFGMLYVCAKTDYAETQFLERMSLLHPHVAENGRNPFYTFEGNYIIFTRTRRDYTQLGYSRENSVGLLKTREPIKARSFKLVVEFQVTPATGGSGYGFWLSDSITKGNYYGRSSSYSGVGVVIDTKGRPFVKFVGSDGDTKSAPIYPSFGSGMSTLIIENHGKRLVITLKVGSTEYTVYSGLSSVQPGYLFGITAATGQSGTPLIFNSISGYAISSTKGAYVKGETTKNRDMVIIFGGLCIAGLVYYLYQKQSKEKEFRIKG